MAPYTDLKSDVFIYNHDLGITGLTIVPLLKKPPDAQKVSETTSSGLAVFVSRFHNAPQAGLLLIISGSLDALSKKMARVGDTIMASRARIPDVPF